MSNRLIVLLALPVIACSGSGAAEPAESSISSHLTTTSAASADGAAKQKADYLASYVRPDTIMRSFHAAEGMWVDCVDVKRQPGMLSPQMVGKDIDQPPPRPALDPSSVGTARPSLAQFQSARQDVEDHADEFDENGSVRRCDPGAIPIRRTTAADLDRFATLNDFRARGGHQHGADPSSVGLEYASQTQYVANWGMQSFINIWQPYLETYYGDGEHTISQIWVQNLSTTLESAEAGWGVDPLAFGDTKSRFFIYWTSDNYGPAGCFDLTCAGFVQTNSSVTLGSYYNTISSIGGTQYESQIAWEKSSATANWWLLFQGQWVGYLPASLFTHGMQTQANTTIYGGEVRNTEPGGAQTATDMGSGQFASGGWQQAAYQRHLQYINLNYNTIDVSPNQNNTTNSNCYSLTSGFDGSGDGWGYYEFLGGPGWNANCQ